MTYAEQQQLRDIFATSSSKMCILSCFKSYKLVILQIEIQASITHTNGIKLGVLLNLLVTDCNRYKLTVANELPYTVFSSKDTFNC